MSPPRGVALLPATGKLVTNHDALARRPAHQGAYAPLRVAPVDADLNIRLCCGRNAKGHNTVIGEPIRFPKRLNGLEHGALPAAVGAHQNRAPGQRQRRVSQNTEIVELDRLNSWQRPPMR